MAIRKSQARWEGTLKEGNGSVKLGSGAFEGQYNFSSRFEEGVGTNPEELLAAAHAGCYSMKLNAVMSLDNIQANFINTVAHVTIGKVGDKTMISKITLEVEGSVPNMDEATFKDYAQKAHDGCIISIALGAVPEIELNAKLV